ncbi:desaturase [Tupanvirus soda lake]|uniref:Desaturase n=2 Tax=Tupanvirus TaxID=2094720 RepID=A0A6N1NMW6_9VIRU|nr:desaturase [Tupanvirus soda lake]QKU35310.1 desaturase [Tupanvirus soda lake]
MLSGFVIIIFGILALMILERIYPDQKLPRVKGWWISVVLINIYQLFVVVLGMYTWEKWLQIPSLLDLSRFMNPAVGGFVAYLINTWIFYWWHRARHEIYILWLLFHQVHHSPQRIEVVTSFYKHPLEILADSIMMTVLLYPVLGLTVESSIWLSGFSAYGEYFYHMNIATPRWIGYIFQRPESHRLHHGRNRRVTCPNHSDLAIWDILGATFVNPKTNECTTGFEKKLEEKRADMLLFRDVLAFRKHRINKKKVVYQILLLVVLGIGCMNIVGYMFNSTPIKAVSFVSGASPLPLVFSAYNGVETFSTTFTIDIETNDNITFAFPLTREIYSNIEGPYNRRNIYGVVFSHGPFFQLPELVALRQLLLKYAICEHKLKFDKYPSNIKKATINIKSKTVGNKNQSWSMDVMC